MVNQQLLDYVREQIDFGASDDAIREASIEAGWHAADIDEAFAAAKPTSTPTPVVPTKTTPVPTLAQTPAPVSTLTPPKTEVKPQPQPQPPAQPQIKPIPVTPVASAAAVVTPTPVVQVPVRVSTPTPPVSTPVAQVIPTLPVTASATTPKTSSGAVNKLLLFLVLVLIIGGAGGGGYYYYTTQQQIATLTASATKVADDLAAQTQQNVQLQQQVAQLSCKGAWNGTTCAPVALSFAPEPKSGSTPLKVTFTIRVPNVSYGVNFGDGTSSWITGGSLSQAQSATSSCTPDAMGLCTVTIAHTYVATSSSSTFLADLTQNGTAVMSVPVAVTKP